MTRLPPAPFAVWTALCNCAAVLTLIVVCAFASKAHSSNTTPQARTKFTAWIFADVLKAVRTNSTPRRLRRKLECGPVESCRCVNSGAIFTRMSRHRNPSLLGGTGKALQFKHPGMPRMVFTDLATKHPGRGSNCDSSHTHHNRWWVMAVVPTKPRLCSQAIRERCACERGELFFNARLTFLHPARCSTRR